MTKKIIIPIAVVIVAAVAAVVCILVFKPNNEPELPDELPELPTEFQIPSGNYYIDGNPQNDDLYIIVNGGNIRFANKDNDLRGAFEKLALEFDPTFADSPDRLKSQLDQDMADWGDDYDYTLRWMPGRTDLINVFFRISIDEEGFASGITVQYYFDTKTLHSWAGDFVLAE